MTVATDVEVLESFFLRELSQLHDRCDTAGCNAQAYILAYKDDVGELTFCAHHGNKIRMALVEQGFEIQDESESLLSRVTGYLEDDSEYAED